MDHPEALPDNMHAEVRVTTPHPPRVLVVQPDAHCPVDRLGGWFSEAGLELEIVLAWSGGTLSVDGMDALLVLGGDMGAYDDVDHPWLAEIRSLLSEALVRELPTMGICLGGQLLAQAAGGNVALGSHGLEAGVVDLFLSVDAAADPLFSVFPQRFASGAYHRDAIDELPANAVLLAGSQNYPHQGYRVGLNAWGLQFHPEVSAESYAGWIDYTASVDPDVALTIQATADEFARRDAEVATSGMLMARRFAEIVTSRRRRMAGHDLVST